MVEIQGRGLLLGLRCDRPAREVLAQLRRRGILAGGATDPSIVRLMPPLTLGAEDVVEALEKALADIGSSPMDRPVSFSTEAPIKEGGNGMTHRGNDHDRHIAIAALRAAAPYLRLFQGKTFVIKAGGQVVADRQRTGALMEQVGLLHRLGIRVVVVHGGGGQATDLAGRLGLESRFVEGRRVTCDAMREVATMTLNGTVNTPSRSGPVASSRVPALGISGVDGGLIGARRRPPVEIDGVGEVDYGHVGDIHAVRRQRVGTHPRRPLRAGRQPVVGRCAEGNVLNVNADVVASRLAREMQAEKLILLTGAAGILEDRADASSLVSYTDLRGLDALLALAGLSGVHLLDQRSLVTDIYREFRQTSLRQILVGGGLVVVLLALRYRAWRPVFAAFLPSMLVASLVLAAGVGLGEPANLFTVMSLVMVMGMGVDYGIFCVDSLGREEELGTTLVSLLLSCLTTAFVFGSLAISSQPSLRAIGLTTGLGVVLSLLLAPVAVAAVGVRPSGGRPRG